MVDRNSRTDIAFDIANNSLGIFGSIMKGRFISELPNTIKDHFDNKSGQACMPSIHTRPLKEENKKAIWDKGDVKKGRQNR